uniref:Uncharacterized protein n=1 Tax=Tanacetum cinerariifolium TaxID=118510 RepID=A0A6L2JU10_TANCI|nr:hypothetical protein [Tanacetum cinerariifolium]
MELSTKPSDRILDLEKIKTAQAKEITDLKKRVKKLERKRRSRTPRMNLFKIGTSRRRSLGEEDASKQGRNLKQRSIFEESDFDVQAMMDADYELAARLKAKEQRRKLKLEKAEKERDELKLTLEKYQNSSKSLNTLLECQVSDKVKTGLGYKAASPAVEDFVNSSEMLENHENVKSISDKGYQSVPLPYIRNYIPPKPDLIFIDEQVETKSVDDVSNVSSSSVKTVESKVEFVDVKRKVCVSCVVQ